LLTLLVAVLGRLSRSSMSVGTLNSTRKCRHHAVSSRTEAFLAGAEATNALTSSEPSASASGTTAETATVG
jgi:hypothetical protein